jgi:hypothetical protein
MAHSERELIDEMVALDQMLKAERAARMAAELKLARATGSGNARTHSPAMALVANLEAQRANARKGSELRAEEAAIRARLGLKELAFAEFPTQVLRTILLSATTHDDFITWVSVCARVCSAWRGVVMGSAAYGAGLPRDMLTDAYGTPSREYGWHIGPGGHLGEERETERDWVLSLIRNGLRQARRLGSAGDLVLKDIKPKIGIQGCLAIGAALQAMPSPLGLRYIKWRSLGLTPAVLSPIVAAMRPGSLIVGLQLANNALGDAGVTAMAAVLPPTLKDLDIRRTGCGDAGMQAVAAALPRLTRLQHLYVGCNRDVGEMGWAALAAALPQLPALWTLDATHSPGMGPTGGAAIAAALPRCARTLVKVSLVGRDIGWQATAFFLAQTSFRATHQLEPNAPGLTINLLENLDADLDAAKLREKDGMVWSDD